MEEWLATQAIPPGSAPDLFYEINKLVCYLIYYNDSELIMLISDDEKTSRPPIISSNRHL